MTNVGLLKSFFTPVMIVNSAFCRHQGLQIDKPSIPVDCRLYRSARSTFSKQAQGMWWCSLGFLNMLQPISQQVVYHAETENHDYIHVCHQRFLKLLHLYQAFYLRYSSKLSSELSQASPPVKIFPSGMHGSVELIHLRCFSTCHISSCRLICN